MQISRIMIATALMMGMAGCGDTGAHPDSPSATLSVESAKEIQFDGSHRDAATFTNAIDAGATVIDVRTPAEFAEGHIPGAINIDVSTPDFATQLKTHDPAGSYAVYCRSGNRSRTAIATMKEAGFLHTLGLEGGVGAWSGELTTE